MLKVIGRLLDFVLVVNVAIAQRPIDAVFGPARPREVIDVFDVLQIHRKTFQSVGNFTGDRFTFDAANLLEIGELRDFHAVQPDFPAEPPRAQSRVFPIVFDKTHIIFFQVQTKCCERTEIEIENVRRRRFQHHLILIVMLQAIRVFAVAPILRAARRLHVRRAPGLGAERTQEGRRMRGSRADLHVVRLQQRATLLVPVTLEIENDFLKRGYRGVGRHYYSDS